MRLLVDLQCVQSTSAVRGIGRYALSLSRALVRSAGPDDQVEVLLNGGDDPDRLQRARMALETFLPARAVHVFEAPWPWQHDLSDARRREAETMREAAVAALAPDVLLVGSVFEGDTENVFSVDSSVPTAALLYDLIPAADPGTYLLGPGADSYWRRFEQMKQVDLLLSISEYSARQARALLGADCPPTEAVWGGPYPSGLFEAFERRSVDGAPEVPPRYLLAVGGDHPRKNLDRLVQAWGRVPPATRRGTALVIACKLNVGTLRRLRRLARRSGLQPGELLLTGEVSEPGLAELYRGALAFVFPSTEEGLGLPPLEAMAAGCPTVLARGSSLSELVEESAAYMNGFDVDDMARAMRRLLEEPGFRELLRRAAERSTERFTWARAAELAWDALRPFSRTPAAADGDLPVMVGSPPAPEVDPVVLAAERELGVTGPLPPGSRAALMQAAGLLVSEDVLARDLVASGLVEQPVVSAPGPLAHDLYAALRHRLADPAFPADVVRAVSFPPRWMLERPWPIWLVLHESPLPPAPHDVVLVQGARGAVILARSVDRVLVDAALLPDLEGDLHRARCRGAPVTVVGGPAPAWADSAQTLDEAFHGRRVRTTGWPWGG